MAFWRRRRDHPAEPEVAPDALPSPEDVEPGWEPDAADFGDDVALDERPGARNRCGLDAGAN